MQTIVREMRRIPFFLLREYLIDMGGNALGEEIVKAPGWQVQLTKMEPFCLGSLSVGQTHLEIEIEDHLVDNLLEIFCRKTLRAGA